MLIDIIRFEWRYHTRQAAFVLAAALFFAGGLLLAATGYGPNNVHVNSPCSIAQSVGLLSLLSVFVLAVFCGNAVVRDRELKTEELVFATPVGKLDFLLGRFAGALLAAFSAFVLCAPGMLAGIALPLHEASQVGPVDPVAYLWALAVVGVPNFVVAAVILFVVATLTRSMLASYAAAVAVYVLYFVAAALSGSPLMAASVPGEAGSLTLASLVDPFALSAFFEQTRFWTPAERNARGVALAGNFLLNRVAWLAVAALAWGALYRAFSFRVVGCGRAKRTAPEPSVERSATAASRVVVPAGRGARAVAAALASATWLEARSILGSLPFLALNLLWAALAATEIWSDVTSGEYGSAVIPTTGFVLAPMMQPLAIVATVIIIYYSAEVVWRERSTSLSGMLDATPVPGALFVVSKWVALCLLGGALVATGMVTAVAIQALVGGAAFDPVVAAGFAWFAFAPIAIFAAAAVAVHTLSPGRFAGIFLLVLVAFYSLRGDVLGLEHRLWRFGSLPPVVHSEMNGFGDYALPFNSFALLWGAVAGALLLVAALAWRREPGGRSRTPLRLLRGASAPARAALASCGLVALAAAGWIYWNTNLLNRYESDDATLAWKAGYETTWKAVASLAQPSVTHVEARADLRPEDRAWRMRGRYELLNDGETPIPGLFVTVRREYRVDSISAPGAKLSVSDAKYGMYRLDFETPLRPGARAELRFDLVAVNRGFTGSGPRTQIVENGSWIPGWVAFPSLGYRDGFEIRDPRERRRRGLPPATREAGVAGDLTDEAELGEDRVTFDITLSTAPDQLAITSGRLAREWMEDGRRVFRYVSDVPVGNQRFNLMSARYEVAREERGGTTVEVYFQRGHGQSVAKIVRAASDTLGYMERNVAPYPFRQLRVVEVPSYWNFGGFAQPDTVVIVDKRGFLKKQDDDAPVDIVYRRIAHEVAHQWWGLGLTPPNGPGASMVVESLTKYAELMVMRRALGAESIRGELVYELDRYLAGRAEALPPEPPLDRVDDESHIYYGKGALVMHAIADLIGEEATNRALRDFYAAESGAGHAATADRLVARLLEETPPERRALVAGWLSDVVVYDVGLEKATASKRSDGRWELAVRVRAAKARVAGDGSESPVAMDEPVTVAVYADENEARLLASSRQPVRSGVNELRLLVDAEPRLVAVDPMLCLIDRDRFDNAKQVERQARGRRQ